MVGPWWPSTGRDGRSRCRDRHGARSPLSDQHRPALVGCRPSARPLHVARAPGGRRIFPTRRRLHRGGVRAAGPSRRAPPGSHGPLRVAAAGRVMGSAGVRCRWTAAGSAAPLVTASSPPWPRRAPSGPWCVLARAGVEEGDGGGCEGNKRGCGGAIPSLNSTAVGPLSSRRGDTGANPLRVPLFSHYAYNYAFLFHTPANPKFIPCIPHTYRESPQLQPLRRGDRADLSPSIPHHPLLIPSCPPEPCHHRRSYGGRAWPAELGQ